MNSLDYIKPYSLVFLCYYQTVQSSFVFKRIFHQDAHRIIEEHQQMSL